MKKTPSRPPSKKTQLPCKSKRITLGIKTLKITSKVSNNKFKEGKLKPWISYPMLLNLRYQGYRKPVSYIQELRKFFTHNPLEKSTSEKLHPTRRWMLQQKG